MASPRQARLTRFQQGVAARALVSEVHCQPLGETLSLNRAIGNFLARPGTLPKALLCANGNATLAATRALHSLGARLGETGLIGIDELDYSLAPALPRWPSLPRRSVVLQSSA